VKLEDFAIGAPESRAIARLIAQQHESERKQAWLAREKRIVAFPILGPPSSESNKPCRSNWFEPRGSKKLCCILWVPPDMSVEEAARIVFPGGV
jgi:hypothetical protein